MSHYHIEVEAAAVKALAQLDKPVRRRLQRAIDRLADEPRPPGVVPVRSMPGCLRMRVGDYRVIYEVSDHHLLVLVIGLGQWREVYNK